MNSRGSRSLLLLTPSVGYISGIERVADAVADAWPGRVERINLYRAGREPVPSGNLRAKVRFTIESLRKSLRFAPDLALSLHLGLLPAAVPVAAAGRAKLAVLVHGEEGWAPLSRTTRLALSRCNQMLATTSFSAHWFAAAAKVDREQVKVVPLPVDDRLVRVADGAVTPERRDAQILSVSRIAARQRYKGLFSVAACLPEVLERRPDVRWVVVGDGDDLPRLRSCCRALGVDHAVEFRGQVSDAELARAYRSATLFALPSVADPEANPPYGEGFGLVYAEAGIFGIPSVACTAGGGSSEFVRHEHTGLTVPPDDLTALSEAVLRLVEDETLRKTLGRNACELARARHLPTRFRDALETALL